MIVAKTLKVQSLLKYLVSALNSKLLHWYSSSIMNSLGGNTTIAQKGIFVMLPVPIVRDETSQYFQIVLNRILDEKKQSIPTNILEDLIDLMVYKLYDLNYEEMRLIDPDLDQVLASFGLDANSFAQLSLKDLQELIPKSE